MNRERKLAHIVAYYLSRFDKIALDHLGFKPDKEAFSKIASALNLLPNYIKFRRDEFDVAFPHRQGWHKRPMSLSISSTINALSGLDEEELTQIVKDVISRSNLPSFEDDIERLTSVYPVEKALKKKGGARIFVPRGITGKKAEEFFISYYRTFEHNLPKTDDLKDVREAGCGYDFEITDAGSNTYFVEIKGLASGIGGIVFTNKEWETCKTKGNDYFLVLVANLDDVPVVHIIRNPAEILVPTKNLITVIQTNWNVTASQLPGQKTSG